MPAQPGTVVLENEKAVLDYSNAADGYFSVKYIAQTTNALRVRVTAPGGNLYTYVLRSDGKFEVFPFSEGNGSYKIETLEQVPDGRYGRVLQDLTVDVKLTDEFAPFIRPNQYVNYDRNSQAVAKAAELVKYSQNRIEEITEIYNWIIQNVVYDKELARTVQTGYLPDVDRTLSTKKGICFDYSALITAMLRSQGIPCKLVIGSAGGQNHAWISVWTKEAGWLNGIIRFDGSKWILLDPTFAAGKNEYTGDGTKYDVKSIR
jgi:transglutaminase-like putative cysteine protease